MVRRAHPAASCLVVIVCSVHLLQTTSKPVQMMSQLHSFPVTFPKDLPAKIVGIPYKNSDLSMFVLLPDDIDGLEKVKPRPAPLLLSAWGLCVPELFVLGEPANRASVWRCQVGNTPLGAG